MSKHQTDARGGFLIATLTLLVSVAFPSVVSAHAGTPPAPHDLWNSWDWNPVIAIGLALIAWVYSQGIQRLWRRVGRGRVVRLWQVSAFVAGMTAIFIALISPLDALGSALFSAHMAQHLILTLVAAPLLVLGIPMIVVFWGIPKPWRLTIGRWQRHPELRAMMALLRKPVVIWVLYVSVTWLWHLPSLYQASLRSDLIHSGQHISFLGTAMLYWWTLRHPFGAKGEGYGVGILSLFGMVMQASALGALFTFSKSAWYPAYELSVDWWGLTLLQDQQLAGALMWLPGIVVYLSAVAALLVALLQESEHRAKGNEKQRPMLHQKSRDISTQMTERETRNSG